MLSFGEKNSLGILGRFVFIDELGPKTSPVGSSTTGSIILLCQVQYLRINVSAFPGFVKFLRLGVFDEIYVTHTVRAYSYN